jgi:hypothetical protein
VEYDGGDCLHLVALDRNALHQCAHTFFDLAERLIFTRPSPGLKPYEFLAPGDLRDE